MGVNNNEPVLTIVIKTTSADGTSGNVAHGDGGSLVHPSVVNAATLMIPVQSTFCDQITATGQFGLIMDGIKIYSSRQGRDELTHFSTFLILTYCNYL